MGLFRRTLPAQPETRWPLDMPLIRLAANDNFSLRGAVQGVHGFGSIGSGKTSGTGQALRAAFLRGGMGGLVAAAKPDEVALWKKDTRRHGRANSVKLLGVNAEHFNFIDYELSVHGLDGIGSIVECIICICKAARVVNTDARGSGDAIWEDGMRQDLRHTIPLIYAATGTVTIPDIIQFITSTPHTLEQFRNEEWQKHSFAARTMLAARTSPTNGVNPLEMNHHVRYFAIEHAGLDPKLRTSRVMTLSTTLDRFTHGRLRTVFCTDTTVVPEMAFHGTIIIMDMPALTWNEDGIIAQQLFKFIFQRAVLRRNGLAWKHQERPVFIYADECQYFINSYDFEYQSTCRSSLGCTVYLSQSLPGLMAKMGGDQAEAKVFAHLANFGTKVFHSSGDPRTNQYASDCLGKRLERRHSYNAGTSSGYSRGMNLGENTGWSSNSGNGSSSDGKGNRSTNYSSGGGNSGGESWSANRGSNIGASETRGYSETMDFEIQPGEFAHILKTGGPSNGNRVSAIWFQSGRIFNASGLNYLFTEFAQ